MGRKVFTREVLSSSDVNAYLMDQAVQSFASSSARSAALPTPVDGMLTYLADAKALELRAGSVWERMLHGTRGSSGAASDSNGWVTITHGLGAVPASVVVLPGGSAVQHVAKFILAAKSSTTFSVIEYNSSNGSVLANNPAPFDWVAYR